MILGIAKWLEIAPLILLTMLASWIVAILGFNQYYFKKVQKLYNKGKRSATYKDTSIFVEIYVYVCLGWQLLKPIISIFVDTSTGSIYDFFHRYLHIF